MKNLLFVIATILFATFLSISCGSFSSDEERIAEAVDSFSTKYFTWDFPAAQPYVDEQGERWLRFMSSNVHGADLEEISAAKDMPEYEITNIAINGDSAIVELSLTNVILMDTLGSRAHMQKEATRKLILKKYDNSWKVNSIQSNH